MLKYDQNMSTVIYYVDGMHCPQTNTNVSCHVKSMASYHLPQTIVVPVIQTRRRLDRGKLILPRNPYI